MKKYIATLTEDERDSFGILTSKNNHKSQQVLNVLILLGWCDKDECQAHRQERSTNEEMAEVLNISMKKIDRVKKRFIEEGLEAALNERKGSQPHPAMYMVRALMPAATRDGRSSLIHLLGR